MLFCINTGIINVMRVSDLHFNIYLLPKVRSKDKPSLMTHCEASLTFSSTFKLQLMSSVRSDCPTKTNSGGRQQKAPFIRQSSDIQCEMWLQTS